MSEAAFDSAPSQDRPDPHEPQNDQELIELAVAGAPEALTALAPRMVYGLLIDQQSLRLSLIAHTALRTLRAGVRCAVVSPIEPAQFLRKASLTGVRLEEFYRAGTLVLLRHEGEPVPGITLLNHARALAQELRNARIERDSLVILDRADARLCLGEPAQSPTLLGSLQEWAEHRGHTVLALFGEGPQRAALENLAERFAGYGALGDGPEATTLSVEHWFGTRGVLGRSVFVLWIDPHGVVCARPSGDANPNDPSQEQHVATQVAARDFEAPHGTWELVESSFDAIDRARSMTAGTVVLHFDRTTSLRDLAQTVAVLRACSRPQLRVIVRECGNRLRISQASALLRLGVNIVIPQETEGVAARIMAESLRGTVSTQAFESDVARALMGADDTGLPRSIGVVDFRAKGVDLVRRAAELHIPATLMRFTLQSRHALKAVIGALAQGVRNCLFTEHEGCIWAVLYGCPPSRAEGVLARLLGARFESLLADLQLIGERDEILRTLRLLDHAALDLADAVFEDTVGKGPDPVSLPFDQS